MKDFNKRLISLVLPMAFQQFMLAVVSASDAVMVGMLSQDAMSAVSLAGQVQFVFQLFLAAMTIGTSMFAAQYWGKSDKNAVERILAIVLRVSIPISFAFTLCTALIPTVLMRCFTPEPLLIKYGADYLQAVCLSYLFCGISQIYLCIMKNSERVFQGALISSVCVILNMILNAFLIFGLYGMPKLGIVGTAVATVIARAVELLWVLFDSTNKNRVKIRNTYLLHIDKNLSKEFWKYTNPVLGNELVWGIGFTMGTVIIGHLNTDAIAANSIINIAKNMVVCFCMGLGTGSGIMIGNELGAGNLKRAKEYGGKLCQSAIFGGVIAGILLLCISPLFFTFANLTKAASEYLKWMFVISTVSMMGKSINLTTISGIFCAGGDSKFGFLCDTIVLWCIVVPMGMFAAFVLKLPVLVIYGIVNLDEVIKLPAVYRNYKKYNWVRDLTVKERM